MKTTLSEIGNNRFVVLVYEYLPELKRKIEIHRFSIGVNTNIP